MSIVQIHQYSSGFVTFAHDGCFLIFLMRSYPWKKLMKIYKKKTTA